MSQKTLFIILFSICTANIFYGQDSSPNWKIISDDEEKVVFIDTSRLNRTGDVVSVWSLAAYKAPVYISSLGEDIYKIKSNYLVKLDDKEYTTIGAIYYNSEGRPAGDGDTPLLSGTGSFVYIDIEEGSQLETIYNSLQDYYNPENDDTGEVEEYVTETEEPVTDTVAVIQDPMAPEDTLSVVTENDTPETGVPGDIPDIPQAEAPEDDTADPVVETEIPDSSETEPVSASEAETDTVITDGEIAGQEEEDALVNSDPVENTEPEIITKEVATENSGDNEYNFEKERPVGNLFFTDGEKYCYQVSSWKTEPKAERRAALLQDKGFDAFVQAAYVESLSITVYRVRVGFFDTLKEAEESKNRL